MTYYQQRAKGLNFNKHLLESIEKKLTASCPQAKEQELEAILSRKPVDTVNGFWDLFFINADSEQWDKLCFQWDTTARIIKELEAAQ